MLDRTKYTKQEILQEWRELDEKLPFKVVTGTLPVLRFKDRQSAMDFYFEHDGRCVVSEHKDGTTKIIAIKDKSNGN